MGFTHWQKFPSSINRPCFFFFFLNALKVYWQTITSVGGEGGAEVCKRTAGRPKKKEKRKKPVTAKKKRGKKNRKEEKKKPGSDVET